MVGHERKIPYPGEVLVPGGSKLGIDLRLRRDSRRTLTPGAPTLNIGKSIRRDPGGVLSFRGSKSAFGKFYRPVLTILY